MQLCFLHTTNIVLIERRRTVYPVLSSNPRAIISILLRLPTLTHGCKHFSVSVIKYVRAPFVYTSVTANTEPCEDILPVTPLRFIQEWKTSFVKFSGDEATTTFRFHLFMIPAFQRSNKNVLHPPPSISFNLGTLS